MLGRVALSLATTVWLHVCDSATVQQRRVPSTWSCEVLTNRTLSNLSSDAWWARENCTGSVGRVQITGIVVNTVQATVGPGSSLLAKPAVATGHPGLAPLSELAKLVSSLSLSLSRARSRSRADCD